MTFSRMTYEPVFPEQAELYYLMHKTMYIMPPTSVYKMLHIFLYFCMEMYFLYFCLMFSYVKYMIYKSIKNYNSIGKLVVFIKGASQSIFILSLQYHHHQESQTATRFHVSVQAAFSCCHDAKTT